jgi:hypothetical protein
LASCSYRQASAACSRVGSQGHALVELALVTGAQQVTNDEVIAHRDFGQNLANVGIDVSVTVRSCDRHAMVAIDHEMQIANAEDVDDGTDDGVERDGLQTQLPFAGATERRHHLLERQHERHVVATPHP